MKKVNTTVEKLQREHQAEIEEIEASEVEEMEAESKSGIHCKPFHDACLRYESVHTDMEELVGTAAFPVH